MRTISVIVHNVRSTHNVGSILRTADGLGIQTVYFTGFTPYPTSATDDRLPHLARKIDAQIHKTALGAEQSAKWEQAESVVDVIKSLKSANYTIVALEQSPDSTMLRDYAPPDRLALIVGREVEGLETEILQLADNIVEIPMLGTKESFNVAVAAAIALYHCRYMI